MATQPSVAVGLLQRVLHRRFTQPTLRHTTIQGRRTAVQARWEAVWYRLLFGSWCIAPRAGHRGGHARLARAVLRSQPAAAVGPQHPGASPDGCLATCATSAQLAASLPEQSYIPMPYVNGTCCWTALLIACCCTSIASSCRFRASLTISMPRDGAAGCAAPRGHGREAIQISTPTPTLLTALFSKL